MENGPSTTSGGELVLYLYILNEATKVVLPFLFNVAALKRNLCIAFICHYKEFQGWHLVMYLSLPFSARKILTCRVCFSDFNTGLSQFTSDFLLSTRD